MRKLLLPFILLPNLLFAQSYTSWYAKCMHSSFPLTDTQSAICLAEEANRQDDRMRYAYNRLYEKSNPKQKIALKKDQQEWERKFRDDIHKYGILYADLSIKADFTVNRWMSRAEYLEEAERLLDSKGK